MTHVVINARFLSQPLTGVQRFARELVTSMDRELAMHPRDWRVRLLAPRRTPAIGDLRCIDYETGGCFHGHAWEQLDLPWLAGSGLLLNLGNTGPALRRRQAVVIHDASVYAHPEAYSRRFVQFYQMLQRSLTAHALRIMTVSEFSRHELEKYLNIDPSRTAVLHEGCDHIVRYESDRRVLGKLGLEPGAFVLGVSTTQPYKNLQRLVEAYRLLARRGMRLVLVGDANTSVFASNHLALPAGVVISGRVSDRQLRALYESAAVFVFPSLYEGFGLPPLEAMACGCPVIVSRAASLPEVCGDAAVYCDPLDERDIADQMRRMLDESTLRETVIQCGLKRAREFTWQRCAQEVLQLLEEVVTL